LKLRELFETSVECLRRAKVPTPALDVKLLLSFVLHVAPNMVVMRFDDECDVYLVSSFNTLLSRRINREPIANIVGHKSFWDYDFFVSQDVLTPRNDSETIIEAILDNYRDQNAQISVMDLGTGSGCLILTLLKIYQNSTGLAIDISKKALDIARKNADLLGVKNVKFMKNHWNKNIEEKFDIIVSNPPYILSKDIKKLEPEVSKFNPKVSLDGGLDGLKCYKYLAKNIKKNMKQSTLVFLEVGINQSIVVANIFAAFGINVKKVYKDIGGIDRVLMLSL